MVPSQPLASSTGTETDIFHLLEEIDAGPDSVAFASVHLSDHEYKKWGEIDFLILTPQGLIVLEVKGGLVSCDSRGIWRYESRGKKPIERLESPMAQASSAYFSLRDKHLYPSLGRAIVDAAPSGFCVALAGTSARLAKELIGGTEMPATLVATVEDARDSETFARFLIRVLLHWCSHTHKQTRCWTPDELLKLAHEIRPWFDRVRPLSLSAARIRQEQIALTEDQYRILDFCERAPRVLCTGGAGCGKTLLAVECLKRETANDPILITGTDALAPHLRRSSTADPSRVISFAELRDAPRSLDRQYGVLIVDEGQQLTNNESVGILSKVLRGGIDGGRWRWFSDPNNQVLRNDRFDPSCQHWLESISFPGMLDHNCRNTPQIVSAVQLLTGASLGSRQLPGQGPEVTFAVEEDRDGQAVAAARHVANWLKDPGISPGEIVLLVPRNVGESSAMRIAALAGFPCRRWQPGWDQLPSYPRDLAVATIEEFRGLEAPFVVLCDITASMSEVSRHFYLGMTRANFGLYVMAEREAVRSAVAQVASSRRVD